MTTLRSKPVPDLGRLSLRDLEYAIAVGKERHFGRAAERCSVSQAALSTQIKKLEQVLGVRLFERTKRSVVPTVRGSALLESAELLLAEARRLLLSAREQAEPLTGELRLGVIATLGPYYLPALLQAGRARFPRLVLRLHEGLTDDLLEALRRSELDAVLVALPAGATGEFTVDALFFEPFWFACPVDHELAKGSDVRLSDLGESELLLMAEGHCLRDQTLALCDVQRFDRDTRASSLEMLRHMIAAGEGYSVLPQLAAPAHEQPGDLVAYRPLADVDAGRTIGLVSRRTEPRANDLREIAQFLRDMLPRGLRGVGAADGA